MSVDKKIEQLKKDNIAIIAKVYEKLKMLEEQMLNELYSDEMNSYQAFRWIETTKEFLIKKYSIPKIIYQTKTYVNSDEKAKNMVKEIEAKVVRDRYYEDSEAYKNLISEITKSVAIETNETVTTTNQFEELIWYHLLYDKLAKGIYKGKESDVVIIDYDNDSSPFAWEYYHTIYKNTIEFNDTNDGYCYYESYPSKEDGITYTRNIAVFNWSKEEKQLKFYDEQEPKLQQTVKDDIKKTYHLEFGGDCSFNFNELKYSSFIKFIEDDKNLHDKLNFCAMMHHSPLNFAIMPRTGSLNLAKGKGYDRLDEFVKDINDFYGKDKEMHREILDKENLLDKLKNDEFKNYLNELLSETILNKAQYSQKNKTLPYISGFLLDVPKMPFDGIKGEIPLGNSSTQIQEGTRKYVRLFYPWVNDDLLKRLIENGNNKDLGETVQIKGEQRLVFEIYMDLAIDYWTAAAKYYEEQKLKKQNKTELDTE